MAACERADERTHLTYAALPGQTYIRLLHRLQEDEQNGPLLPRFEINTYDLLSSPEYTALSYTWGACLESDETPPENLDLKHFVECGGQLCSVTENLHDFLCMVDVPILWVDALCINQQDDHEKAAQASRMGEIYSAAKRVVMWLGKNPMHMDKVSLLHDRFLPEVENRVKSGDTTLLSQCLWEMDPAFLNSLGVQNRSHWRSCWISYLKFFQQRRFFHRAWIAQEFALGRTQTFLCGTEHLAVNRMNLLRYYILNSRWSWDLPFLEIDYAKPANTFSLMMSIRGAMFEVRDDTRDFRLLEGGPEGLYFQKMFREVAGALCPESRWFAFLAMMLDIARPLSAADPRDKVFSLLGLVNLHLPKSIDKPPIYPSYDESCSSIFTSTATRIIESLPFLTFLSLCIDEPDPNTSGLPSWVPDLRASTEYHPLIPFVAQELRPEPLTEEQIELLRFDLYNASGADPAQPAFRKVSGNTLSVSGAYFDTVEAVTLPLEEVLYNAGLATVLGICGSLRHAYQPTGQHCVEALWRTMVGDLSDSNHPAEGTLGECFSDFVLWILSHHVAFDVEGEKSEADQRLLVNLLDETNPDDCTLAPPT